MRWLTRCVTAAGGAAAASTYKSEARLRQLLVAGEIFLGSALSASLTKMTLRAMDLLGESSPAAKEMQVCVCARVCVFRLSLAYRLGAFLSQTCTYPPLLTQGRMHLQGVLLYTCALSRYPPNSGFGC